MTACVRSHQLWLRTVLRKERQQRRRANPYQHCCRYRMISSIPRLGTWCLRIWWRRLKTSWWVGYDEVHSPRRGMHLPPLPPREHLGRNAFVFLTSDFLLIKSPYLNYPTSLSTDGEKSSVCLALTRLSGPENFTITIARGT